ncbi:LOW QUALITY PROTEIN: calcyclin-binding protein [Mycteria americana]|uniref:LOW QUALITY PROTEIN: calcyclin-binding protein n=1 Tax=Mycteria americana TaxID=33587 RepID=UPI003F581BAC
MATPAGDGGGCRTNRSAHPAERARLAARAWWRRHCVTSAARALARCVGGVGGRKVPEGSWECCRRGAAARDMAAAREELQKDLEEVKELLAKATRKRLCDVLMTEKHKLELEIKNQPPSKPKVAAEEEKLSLGGYTVKINNYGWDQSDKFIKIYISLNGVQKLPAENVQVNFTERSFDLLVKNLNGKNYTMTFNNLLKPISVEDSSRKIKTDTVLVMCRKKREEKWDCLTQVEKESKEKEKAAYDTSDPSEGLMNLLKKMYAEGDDEMKRTINKAWVESREKQSKGDIPMDI